MIVALGGQPASGKSTIAKKILSQLGTYVMFDYGKLKGHFFKNANVVVFGIYGGDDETFQGTDKLSMAVQPDAINFIKNKAKLFPGANLFFEGDRLFTLSFLEVCRKSEDLKVFVLQADSAMLNRRYELRGGSQAESFLTGRRTKIMNILNAVNGCEVRQNDLSVQSEATAEEILSLLVLRRGPSSPQGKT